MAEIVILGAGLSGLSTAYHLEQIGFQDFKIFEKNHTPGGLLKSFYQDGFTFDFTGHLLHISDDYFRNFLHAIAGIENFNLVSRKSFIYLHSNFIPYPFQTNLYNLPTEVVIDSIYGFINRKKELSVQSFHDWVLKYFGAGLAKHFFFPYNKKLLSYDITKITPSWTGRFVPKTDLKEMLRTAIEKRSQTNVGYNNKFYYPKNGGIQYLITQLSSKIKKKIHTNHKAINIDVKNKIIYFENGQTEKYKKLVTTMPLDYLLKSLKEESNTNLKINSDKLICNGVFNFNLGFNVENLTNKHWIYFPDTKYPFYRIGFWHNISPTSVKKRCSAIYGEFSYIPGTKTEKQISNLLNKSKNNTLKILGLKKTNIVTEKMLHLPHAYVIYDFWREKNLKKLLEKLEQVSIYSIGRYGEWKYSSMQEAVLDGKRTSESLVKKIHHLTHKRLKGARREWNL